jgi:GNAT superfamily N-acetyltransferase
LALYLNHAKGGTILPERHDRRAFSSGIAALDDFLLRFAVQQSKKGVAVVRVLVDSEQPQKILGYYSLSAAQIDVLELPEPVRKKLPRYPVPCFRIRRLAVDTAHQGSGLGRLLLGCAVDRCLEARRQVAAYAVVVDAKDEKAKAFYLHYGFIACQDKALTLYLPLEK